MTDPEKKPCRANLLVVDDDADVCAALRLALQRDGHSVQVARDGIEAMRLASQAVPDLVLLDLMLPGMDGYATFQALRQHLSPTKVNIAALGNMVPHLHWHVIARFDWDSHFPAPVWAAAQRPSPAEQEAALRALLPALEVQLQSQLAQWAAR